MQIKLKVRRVTVAVTLFLSLPLFIFLFLSETEENEGGFRPKTLFLSSNSRDEIPLRPCVRQLEKFSRRDKLLEWKQRACACQHPPHAHSGKFLQTTRQKRRSFVAVKLYLHHHSPRHQIASDKNGWSESESRRRSEWQF